LSNLLLQASSIWVVTSTKAASMSQSKWGESWS
jgi:hypothetical protein